MQLRHPHPSPLPLSWQRLPHRECFFLFFLPLTNPFFLSFLLLMKIVTTMPTASTTHLFSPFHLVGNNFSRKGAFFWFILFYSFLFLFFPPLLLAESVLLFLIVAHLFTKMFCDRYDSSMPTLPPLPSSYS